MKRTENKQWALREESRGLQFSPALLVSEHISALRDEGRTIYHMAFGEAPFPIHPLLEESLIAHIGRQGSPSTYCQFELHSMALRYFAARLELEEKKYLPLSAANTSEFVSRIHRVLEGSLLIPVPCRIPAFDFSRQSDNQVIYLPLQPDNSYRLTPLQLKDAVESARQAGENPRKLYLGYPGNPAGQDYNIQELQAIARIARDLDILIISDESNGTAVSGYGHQSIATWYPEGTVVLTGLPGQLAFGGFSFSVALIPACLEHLYQALRNTINANLTPFTAAVQYGFMAAFQGNPEIEEYISICSRIQYVINNYVSIKLEAAGLHCPSSPLAFYLYPDFEGFRSALASRYGVYSSEELAESLLLERMVATLPGTLFGDESGFLRLRISTTDFNGKAALDYCDKFGLSMVGNFMESCCSRIDEGVQRIIQYLR